MILPANRSTPWIGGCVGSERGPEPSMTASAVNSRVVVRIRQYCRVSSQEASSTSSPNLVTFCIPSECATVRVYSQISGPLAKVRCQFGFGANDSEYRCEGTSHASPG